MDFFNWIDLGHIMQLIGVDTGGLIVNGVSLAALVTWLTSLIRTRTSIDPKVIAWGLSIFFAIFIGTAGQIPIVAQVLAMLAQAAAAWVGGTVLYKLGKSSKSSKDNRQS